MRPIELTLSPANVDADGLAAVSASSGTSVTLNGALAVGGAFSSSDSLGRIICVKDSSTNTQSDVTFTLTGTDANGDAITNTITGPGSGATVVSTKFFKTVSSVSVSAAQGGTETVDIGTVASTLSAVSQAIPLEPSIQVPPMVSIVVSGTVTFTVQETFDNLLTTKDSSGNITWQDVTALASKSATTNSVVSQGSRGLRIKIVSYSNGASLKVRIISERPC